MCSQTPKQGNVNMENNGKKWLRSYKESLTQLNIVSGISWLQRRNSDKISRAKLAQCYLL